ncbi:hypothetical protein ES707_05399 [subsurface metagenome]
MEPGLDNLSDAELSARYAAGEEDAFREVVNRYKNGLYVFLRRFLNHEPRELRPDPAASAVAVHYSCE